ncbi:HNH endonuclease [Microbacterium lacus]|uniref:HNH endonuclease n=1 Tax=Microbacterium lacus TaxID=415217 RepID=UPI0018E251F3|nr:HNH endonuclease [Microbacterium lacus]
MTTLREARMSTILENDTEPEVWKPVVGYEAWYAVSSQGRVMRTGAAPGATVGMILATPPDSNGHPRVNLSAGDGVQSNAWVHRMMGDAFLPNPNGFPVVRHLNDIPDDNRIGNLTWGTQSENMYDVVTNGLHAMANKTHCDRGHAFTEENTHTYRGRRICRKCVIIRTAAYRRRKQMRE